MSEPLDTLAAGVHAVAPDFVRLPSLTFVLPHWLYWAGLLIFPLVAMYLVRREEAKPRANHVSQPIAWLFWVTGGFIGLHRFYLKSAAMGFVYMLLFVLVLYGNRQAADARDVLSATHNARAIAEFDVERFQKAVKNGVEGAEAKLARAKQALIAAETTFDSASASFESWRAVSGTLGFIIALLLLADAARMRRLIERCQQKEAGQPPPAESAVLARRRERHAHPRPTTAATRLIDRINGWIGQFIAFWAVIAVFVYYYEVVARYVFNSPTNWAHESMFLMFGMQYLLSGGYALREDAHVRVDIIYEKLSERTKAIVDLVTSVFFFIFTGTLMVTGTIFALDSLDVWEVSFTEWAIQYWPVKCTIALGALFIVLQGLARVVQDVLYLRDARA